MISLNQRYEQLSRECGRHQRVFQFVGIPDPVNDGAWIKKPTPDPDYGNTIPQLRLFFINPRQQQERIEQLAAEGWKEYVPVSEPEGIKPVNRAIEVDVIESEPEEEKPKRRRSSRKSKTETDK